MAIIGVKEKEGGISGGDKLEGLERTYKTVWLVHSNDTSDGIARILNASGLPTVGSIYVSRTEHDSMAVVVARNVTNCQSCLANGNRGNIFDVEIEWSNKITFPGSQSADGRGAGENPVTSQQSNPLNRLPNWSLSWRQTTEYVVKDANDNDITMSNFAEIENGYPVEVYEPIIQIDWFSNHYSIDDCLEWESTINSAIWLGRPAKSLRVLEYTYASHWENGIFCAKKQCKLAYKRRLWHPAKYLDCGYYSLDLLGGPDTKPVLFMDRGRQIGPLPLDGFGGRLPNGSALVYNEIFPYLETDFTNLLT